MKQLFGMHADICKTLSSPKRIEIINLLRGGEKPVSWLLKSTGLLKANLSQHLAVMRSKGIVKTRKDGLKVYYSIANPKIIKACDLMREVLIEQIKEKREALRSAWKQ